MSWASNLIGKIPVVGHAINQVGKVLPSAGQLVGAAALGPLGQVIGGKVDPHTTATQKGIGDAAAAAAGGTGIGKLLTGGSTLPVAGAGGGTTDPTTGDPTDPFSLPPAGGTGGTDWLGELASVGGDIGALIKKYGPTALEGVNIALAAKQQSTAQNYATGALKTTQDLFNAKQPLRTAGQAGMLNPSANTPNLSNIRQLSTAGSGNPFAKALPVAGAAVPFGASNQPALPVDHNGYSPPPPGAPGTIPQHYVPGAQVPTLGAGGLPNGPTQPTPTLPVAPSPAPPPGITMPPLPGGPRRLTLPVAGA